VLTTHTRFMPTHDGSESGSRQHRARDWRHVRTATSHHSPCAESQDAWQWCGDQAFLDHMPDQVQQSSRGRSALDRRRRESSAARPAARPEALVEPCSTRLRPKGAAEPHPTISLGRPDHPTVGSNQVFGLCPGPNCYVLHIRATACSQRALRTFDSLGRSMSTSGEPLMPLCRGVS
jgi:hypothetical protein